MTQVSSAINFAAITAAMVMTFNSAPEGINEVSNESHRQQSAYSQQVDSISQRISELEQMKSSRTPEVAAPSSPDDVVDFIVGSQQPQSPSGQSGNSSPSQQATRGEPSGSSDIPGVPQWKVAMFDQLSECESGRNWSINTGNGFSGGLQFLPSTWTGFGGGEFAPSAHLATREQQIIIADKVQKSQGWGAWPACSARYGYL